MVRVLAWAELPPGWESLELILLRQDYGGQGGERGSPEGLTRTDWDLWEEWDLLLQTSRRTGKMPVSRCGEFPQTPRERCRSWEWVERRSTLSWEWARADRAWGTVLG